MDIRLYHKLGCQLMGVLEDCPPGYQRHGLKNHSKGKAYNQLKSAIRRWRWPPFIQALR